MTKKTHNEISDEIRAIYMPPIVEHLQACGEEVLVVGKNKIAIPCVDSQQEEQFLTITFSVPTGSRDGEPYDGYAEAEDFRINQEKKQRKAQEAAAKKAQKIAQDEKKRQAKAAARQSRAENS